MVGTSNQSVPELAIEEMMEQILGKAIKCVSVSKQLPCVGSHTNHRWWIWLQSVFFPIFVGQPWPFYATAI